MNYDKLTEDEREQYEERAAIMEYDGRLSRREAELASMTIIVRQSAAKLGDQDNVRK